jgi:hypothetical protein
MQFQDASNQGAVKDLSTVCNRPQPVSRYEVSYQGVPRKPHQVMVVMCGSSLLDCDVSTFGIAAVFK